jgi:hypothetical protein
MLLRRGANITALKNMSMTNNACTLRANVHAPRVESQ